MMRPRELAPALPHAARELIERHFGAAAHDAEVAPLDATTNFVARVQIAGERFALRAPLVRDAITRVDRVSERCILEQAALAGIAPEIVACDAASGVLFTRWIEGSVWTPERAREEASLIATARLFRTLHGLPVPAAARRYQLEHLIDEYLAGFESADVAARSPAGRPLQASVERCRALHGDAIERLRRLPRLGRALCHNDAHCRNLIASGQRLWLLDWEYAGEGEILFDLAGYAAQNGLDDRQAALLLQAYGTDAAATRSFADWRWLFDYVSLAWLIGGLLQEPDSPAAGTAPDALLARLSAAPSPVGHSRPRE